VPDGNGAEFISAGDPRVDAALKRLRESNNAPFKELEDALLVQIHLEQKQAAAYDTRLKDAELVQRLHQNALARHQEWLEIEQQAIKRHEEWLAGHEGAMSNIDVKLAEITEKANFLFDREMKREGGPEAP
jgi:tRNA A37 N6-isopentenylltransferase MiaA